MMGQRKSALPIQALPIPPQQALPIPPLSQQGEAYSDAQDAVFAMLAYLQHERAKHKARTKTATGKHIQLTAERQERMREDWTAKMSKYPVEKQKAMRGTVARAVARHFDVDTKTVRRATADLRK